MEAFGVEPGYVLDDREFELGSGAPDAVAGQLGLEAVDEGFRRVSSQSPTEAIVPGTP